MSYEIRQFNGPYVRASTVTTVESIEAARRFLENRYGASRVHFDMDPTEDAADALAFNGLNAIQFTIEPAGTVREPDM